MPIITGSDSDFGRLVVEEFNRRAQRIVDLGQAAPAVDVEEAAAGDGSCDDDDDDGETLIPR